MVGRPLGSLAAVRQPAGLWKRHSRAAAGGATGLPSTVTPRRFSSRVAGVVSDFAIEGDPAILDHPFDIAARGDPGAGEQLGDALRTGLARRAGRLAPRAARETAGRAARLWRRGTTRRFCGALRRAGTAGTRRSLGGQDSFLFEGNAMLFGTRERHVKRILIVEDEPLVAFDNETMVTNAGYTVVATVDSVREALAVLEREAAPSAEESEEAEGGVDLILTDIQLTGKRTGIDLAAEAQARGIPVLLATANPPEVAAMAIRWACCASRTTSGG